MKDTPLPYPALDLQQLKVFPLEERNSRTRIDEILINPSSPLPECSDELDQIVSRCADSIQRAREKNASVMLIYGAHLLRNGAGAILERLMAENWITHVATNGAGTIHDWEFSFLGKSSECVRSNVATGSFGTWDETGKNIHLALLSGGLSGLGYGQALGRFIMEDGCSFPSVDSVLESLKSDLDSPRTSALADLLKAYRRGSIPTQELNVSHPWKQASIIGQAYRHGVPLTVHPGIGYDIIANHPMFDGAVIGRAAEIDFRVFGQAVANLEEGVVLSIGSAIMGPQVFEKSLSCVNNLRLQTQKPIITNHQIYVVDLQDGGRWDWSKGEPPKTNPAYYLRFCKSYARMGGTMNYACMDNTAFVHRLYQKLENI